MTPEQMQANWGNLLELAGATIVATSEPTHVPGKGESRTIDYAVCSSLACPWVRRIAVDLGVEASPHRAVRITVNAQPKNYLIQEHATAKPIPRERPIGCARMPVLPSWCNSTPCCLPGPSDNVRNHGAGGNTALEALEPHSAPWLPLAHAMENDLCRIHDIVGKDGMG